jgi:hypothetical protein
MYVFQEYIGIFLIEEDDSLAGLLEKLNQRGGMRNLLD